MPHLSFTLLYATELGHAKYGLCIDLFFATNAKPIMLTELFLIMRGHYWVVGFGSVCS